MMQRSILLLSAFLAGCGGEAVTADNFGNPVKTERPDAEPMAADAAPVRIGELGPNFGACAAAGTPRRVGAAQGLAVRAAPFETAAEIGAIPAGARFFVCSRSHDQRWLGVVFEEGGTLAPACGVSRPVTSRRAYDGPCRSGWVASAFVKLVAG